MRELIHIIESLFGIITQLRFVSVGIRRRARRLENLLLIRTLVSAVALALVSSLAVAQAPHITPAGDPSVKADTIYRLAVKPEDFPEEAGVLLLDDGVLHIEPDGREESTYRQITQILRPEAVDRYREQQFSYAPKHQRFTLNWIRVVKPDGTVVSAAPSQVQESDVPAQFGDPTYSDEKVIRASLTGVAPGTIVDVSYTTTELKPFLAGDFFDSWNVSSGPQVMRSRYVVDVPAGFTPRIREDNLNFARTEKTANGRHTYTWATSNIKRIKSEAFESDSNGVYMSVVVSSPTTWAAIGKWYAGNARDRYVASPAVDSAVTQAVKGAKTLDDSIRAVHRWVAQDIRYVSIALGLGGYQPRSPDEVVRTGFGDCKDKATLFIVALKRLGITAFPVILNSSGHVQRSMPSISQLDHAIAAFKRPGDTRYEFADLTASLTPLGELPFDYQGEFGMIVHPDGSIEEITFPKASIADNSGVRRIVGTLSADGQFTGTYEETGVGSRQYSLRSAFENPLDSAQRAKAANAIAGNIFEGAQGDSLTGFAGKDLAVKPKMSVIIRNGRAASMAGTNAILTNPFGTMSGFSSAAKEIESAGPRLFPIAADKIFGYGVTTMEFRVTMPDGWHAQLPADVDASSEFGKYHSEYAQSGRELVVKRTITGAGGNYAPDQLKPMLEWMRKIATDDAKLIVIEKGAR
jgi:transglutaminase-like putative cysteine protease